MVKEQEDNLDELRKLYPQFTDEQLRAAEETLQNYVSVMARIYTSGCCGNRTACVLSRYVLSNISRLAGKQYCI